MTNNKNMVTKLIVITALGVLCSAYVYFVNHKTNTGEDFFELGQYYFNQDEDPSLPYDLKKARKFYMLSIDEDSRAEPLVWYQLGRIDFLEGHFFDALDKFDRQVQYFGDAVPNVHYMIGLTNGYLARQNNDQAAWERAEAGFKNYLKFASTSPWARTDLAWVYFSQGEYKKMLPVLKKGLNENPTNPWLLNMYGLALLNTNKPDQAKVVFKKAQNEVARLTPEEWGQAYPGNHPDSWSLGLDEFKSTIAKNLSIAETQ